MDKTELAAILARKADLTQAKAAAVIDALFSPRSGEGIIAVEVEKGGKVSITGFGTFEGLRGSTSGKRERHAISGIAPATTRDAGDLADASQIELVAALPMNLDSVREELTQVMTPRIQALDPVPHATVEQARQLAALRTRLLKSGAVRYEDIAAVRGAKIAAVRQSVNRAVKRSELFTVSHDGKTLIPAFQLDDNLEPLPELQPPLRALRDAGEQGWALWVWFATPSAWLDGQRPVDLLELSPEEVAGAALRRASNVA